MNNKDTKTRRSIGTVICFVLLVASASAEPIAVRLKSSDCDVAAAALEQITTNEIPLLLEMVADRTGATKSYEMADFELIALAGFAKLKTKAVSAIPNLEKLLEKEDCSIGAAMCLSVIGAEAIPVLIKALDNTNAFVRRSVIPALGSMEKVAKKAIPKLLQALEDQDRMIRYMAAESLGRIGQEPERVIPALIKLLDDPETTARWNAATALGEFGPLAKMAIPGLKKLAHDNFPFAREKAVEALKKIDPSTVTDLTK